MTVGQADDYALTRVPAKARYPWWSVALQRFGQLSALSQFLLGATLGFGMSFRDALIALTLGAVLLDLVCILVGVIGSREGLTTSVVARWTGFGRGGSAILSLAIGISLIGWFGIQTAVAANGLESLIGGLPSWGWSIVFGMLVTLIAVSGFHSMAWTAYISVPAFMALVTWSVIGALSERDTGALFSSAPAGPQLTIVEGTTLVAGGFIVGAVIAPDMTRYNRSARDVVKQTVVGFTLGEYVIGLAGVLLAHAARSQDVIFIITSSVGWVGVLVIILGTVKINDWNLYSAGLGFTNVFGLFGGAVNRRVVTAVVGILGSLLAAGGLLTRFVDFLILLGVVFPPVAGIMAAEYFVVRKWRASLDVSRVNGTLPACAPNWVPATLAIWAASAVVGHFVTFVPGSLISLVSAFILYVAAGKAGMIRGFGESFTYSRRTAAEKDSDEELS